MKDAYYTKEELKQKAKEECDKVLEQKKQFAKKYFVDKCSYKYGTTIFKVYERNEDKLLKLGFGENCDKPIITFYDYNEYLKWSNKVKDTDGKVNILVDK